MESTIRQDLGSMKIAIVDDDMASIALMRKKLESCGYDNVVSADTGLKGLSLVKENIPDLVVLDVVMPDMNGYELCVKLREDKNCRDIPVIMVTGGAIDSNEAIGTAFESGATDFISKPIKPVELLARIKNALKLKYLNDCVKAELEGRKKAERERGQLRHYLENIINSMPSVIVGVDSQGKVTLWNSEAEKVSGMFAENMEGCMLEDVFPQFSEEMRESRQAIITGEPQKYEKEFICENGEKKKADITIYPLLEKGLAEAAVIRIDDVTERVRAEERIFRSEKIVSMGWLAVGMAHEISNPLAGVLQNFQLIRKRLFSGMLKNRRVAEETGTTMEIIRGYLEKRGLTEMFESVKDEGLRVSKIVNNILSLSRKACFSYDYYSLEEIMDGAVDLLFKSSDLNAYGLEQIEFKKEYDCIPVMFCDRHKLEQALFNILKNSVYATCGNTEKVIISKIILRIKQDENMSVMEIEDNGMGMEEKVKKRIFEPFFTTRKVDAVEGVGLSISYFIITENHGGSIEVDSLPGRGSRFVIKLPVGDGNNAGVKCEKSME